MRTLVLYGNSITLSYHWRTTCPHHWLKRIAQAVDGVIIRINNVGQYVSTQSIHLVAIQTKLANRFFAPRMDNDLSVRLDVLNTVLDATFTFLSTCDAWQTVPA